MSTLGTIYNGNVSIQPGCDTSIFGLGDLNVTNHVYISGTNPSTFNTNGSLVVQGGIGVVDNSVLSGIITIGSLYVISSSNLQGDLTVLGNTNLSNITVSNAVLVNSSISNLSTTFITTGQLMVNNTLMNPSVNDIFTEGAFSAANNVTTPALLGDLNFTSGTARAFQSIISVSINSPTDEAFALYELRGVRNSNIWRLQCNFLGDNTKFSFSIDPSGLIYYTNQDTPNWTSTIIKYKATTLTV